LGGLKKIDQDRGGDAKLKQRVRGRTITQKPTFW